MKKKTVAETQLKGKESRIKLAKFTNQGCIYPPAIVCSPEKKLTMEDNQRPRLRYMWTTVAKYTTAFVRISNFEKVGWGLVCNKMGRGRDEPASQPANQLASQISKMMKKGKWVKLLRLQPTLSGVTRSLSLHHLFPSSLASSAGSD